MRIIILVFAAVVLNINFALAQDSKHLRFGILAYRPKDITTAQWLPFTRELEQALPGYTVELSVLMYPELDAEVKNKSLDFVLTNPEHYILLNNSSSVNAIATLIKLENGHPTTKFAGVIFTRADRADIQQLEDLNGKTIASPAENSLGGYLMERWELEKRHVQARYSFTGMPHDKVIDEVLSGKADAGFVRSGLLESLARSGKLILGANSPIRLLAPHSADNDMPVLHSTEDYPEWAFAVAPHVNADIVRRVSLFLLQIKPDSDMAKTAEIAGFNPPADYIPVEILMLRLSTHPNELKYFNFSDFIWRYRESFVVLAGSGLILLIMILFLIRTNRRFKKIARENQKLLLAVEQSPVSVVITDLKADIEYVNRHFTEVTGYEFTEVAGKNPRLLQSGKMPKSFYDEMWSALSNGKTWRGEMINRRKDGSEYIELTLITPVKQADQRITHYLAIKQDITERKQAEEALRKAQRYARNLIETSLDPLVTISVDGKIMDVNKASESVTGYSREELIGSDFCDYFTEPDEARVGYQKVFAESAVTDYPLAIRHKSGHSIDVLYNATVYRNEAGDVEGVFAAARDITERKAIEDQIKQLAFYDTLTGLPNRQNLFDRLNYSIALSYREGRKLAVLMMDLDKFKAVNDTLGHSAGDELLKQVAARITLCLRDSDMVARLGGDEFVVVVERIGKPEDAAQVAVKIIEVLTVPFELSKNDGVQIGVSIGISFYPQHGSSPATLVDCADTALYRAKANGRGCFSYYEN